jgi:hypothetical protein
MCRSKIIIHPIRSTTRRPPLPTPQGAALALVGGSSLPGCSPAGSKESNWGSFSGPIWGARLAETRAIHQHRSCPERCSPDEQPVPWNLGSALESLLQGGNPAADKRHMQTPLAPVGNAIAGLLQGYVGQPVLAMRAIGLQATLTVTHLVSWSTNAPNSMTDCHGQKVAMTGEALGA